MAYFLLTDGDDILTHERGTRHQMVDNRFVFELSIITARITHTIPRFETDERSIFLLRTPECNNGAFVVKPHSHASVRIEELNATGLAIMTLHRIIGEEFIIETDESFL